MSQTQEQAHIMSSGVVLKDSPTLDHVSFSPVVSRNLKKFNLEHLNLKKLTALNEKTENVKKHSNSDLESDYDLTPQCNEVPKPIKPVKRTIKRTKSSGKSHKRLCMEESDSLIDIRSSSDKLSDNQNSQTNSCSLDLGRSEIAVEDSEDIFDSPLGEKLESDSSQNYEMESPETSVTLNSTSDDSVWSIFDWDSPIKKRLLSPSSDEEPRREQSDYDEPKSDISLSPLSGESSFLLSDKEPCESKSPYLISSTPCKANLDNISPIKVPASSKKMKFMTNHQQDYEYADAEDFVPCSQLNHVQWLPLSSESNKENLDPENTNYGKEDIYSNSSSPKSPKHAFWSLSSPVEPESVFDC